MDDDSDNDDWYNLLGVPMSATVEQISQAYRKLARKYHPDRNQGNPDAAEIFIKLKKAHEVLLHEDQRKAYDAKIQARILKKKKREEMTAGRRKLKDDLVMRESLHKRQKTSEEAEVKVREAEIQRLREEGRRKREQEQSKRAEAEATASRKSNNDANTDSAAIKVKWNTKLADYSQEQIKSIFSAYGPVQHVAARPEKGRAAVLYEDTMDAIDAMNSMSYSNVYHLNLEWMKGRPPQAHADSFSSTPGSFPVFSDSIADFSATTNNEVPAQSPSAGANFDEFEAQVLRRMQEAAKVQKEAGHTGSVRSSEPPNVIGTKDLDVDVSNDANANSTNPDVIIL